MTEVNAGFGGSGGLGASVSVGWCNAVNGDPNSGTSHRCKLSRGHTPPHVCGKEKDDTPDVCGFEWT